MSAALHTPVPFDAAVQHAQQARQNRGYARDCRKARPRKVYDAMLAEEQARYHEAFVRRIADDAITAATGSASHG